MANIKLTARLKAYGKLDVSQNYLPHPTIDDAGKFVGIGNDGSYTLFENATEQQIDDIVNNKSDINIPNSKKSFIDSLFD